MRKSSAGKQKSTHVLRLAKQGVEEQFQRARIDFSLVFFKSPKIQDKCTKFKFTQLTQRRVKARIVDKGDMFN
jgi:hypothetical protein